MGDVNAVNELICPHCSSIGSVLIACVNCREISYCSTCEPEINSNRYWSPPKGTWIFETYTRDGTVSPFNWISVNWKSISSTRCCNDCWNKWREKIQFAFADEVYHWLDLDLMEFSKQHLLLDAGQQYSEMQKMLAKLKRVGFDSERFRTPTLDSINE